MMMTLIFAVLLLVAAVSLIVLLINVVRWLMACARKADLAPAMRRVRRNMIAFVVACVLCVGFVWITQRIASTPAIRGEAGRAVEGSVAELQPVVLNGRKEWISIRGRDKTKPVLLFLAGGPGGSQMAAVRYDLAELENHFVVVNWDQPGSGKSYGAATGSIAPQTYIDDGHALTRYLCETFGQDKIYLVGESWGSALGVFLIDRAPELYHAFIGTGQMIAFLDTEKMDYERAMELARDKGDDQTLATLVGNGPPPYYGADVTWKSAAYLQYLSAHMAANPKIQNGGYNTFRDLFASEYGMLDKINYFRGIVSTFNTVYPQLYEVDLRSDYTALNVPVYFFLGRHDINAPTSLVEEYFAVLDAPEKEIVWFEHSGHSPWINERDLFVTELLRVSGLAR